MPKLSMTFTQDDVKKACAYYAASLNRTFENAEVRLTHHPEERDPRGSSGPSVTATITSKEPVEAPE